MVTSDPVLTRFREALAELYGARLERAILFGSRAGDARRDSDYDVAVFLVEMPDRWEEMKRLPISAQSFSTKQANSSMLCHIAPARMTSERR